MPTGTTNLGHNKKLFLRGKIKNNVVKKICDKVSRKYVTKPDLQSKVKLQ